MKALVLSHRHELLPFAHRLVREGVDVATVVWSHDAERAWDGQLAKALRGSDGTLTQERLAELAQGRTVLTNVPGARSYFPAGQRVFDSEPTGLNIVGVRPYLRLVGWFDGEAWSLRCLVVEDLGVWQGGLGPATLPGAATLVRIDHSATLALFDQLAAPVRDVLKSQGFMGLASIGLDLDGPEGPRVSGALAGWPWLTSHAFVSELEGFVELLGGGAGRLASKYVVVVPVSLPPWPSHGKAESYLIGGLTPQQMGRVFWHDVVVNPEARSLHTAGLDGLVGITRGAAESLALAQGRALEIALRLRLPEKQFRPDAGGIVATELARLENEWGVVL